jgi:hypothetical protein
MNGKPCEIGHFLRENKYVISLINKKRFIWAKINQFHETLSINVTAFQPLSNEDVNYILIMFRKFGIQEQNDIIGIVSEVESYNKILNFFI